jgi:hypothetical protein
MCTYAQQKWMNNKVKYEPDVLHCFRYHKMVNSKSRKIRRVGILT